MKIRIASKSRRAISPIIATVLIIAVTLIASVAIGGFVFGIFAQGQNSAQIAVTGTALNALGFTSGTGGTITCTTAAPALPYLTLTNTGTGSSAVASITITWAGSNNAYALTASTTCSIGAAGTTAAQTFAQFVATPKVSVLPVSGQAYTGTVTLTNGAQLLFTGTWQ